MGDLAPLQPIPPAIRLLDQTLLPHSETWLEISTVDALCEAIASLRIRGAPLLGIAGAAGVALAAETTDAGDSELRTNTTRIASTRPTAIELSTGAHAALAVALGAGAGAEVRRNALWAHLSTVIERRRAEDRLLGEAGAALLSPGAAVLTHCNTGALATGGIGSALGVVRVAWERGLLARCFATETRPLLQGARLTAWELRRAGIPSTLLPDTAAAALIASGRVSAVITGADRIALNGDTANKVGTYGLALAAAKHGVPFYIAAPRTTFDPETANGAAIPIEERDAAEVGGFGGQRWSPDGLAAFNPAFDVTPGELITAFITEAGVVRPSFETTIPGLLQRP